MGAAFSHWMPGTTPFRYPGGKAFLYPDLCRRLDTCGEARPKNYAEPFAGGAGAAIKLLFERRIERVFLNDFDWRVYAAWKAMLDDADRFHDAIMAVNLDVETWRAQREIVLSADHATSDLFAVGFATFYLNRTNRSGIIVGAGPIGGYEQNGRWGLDARFPREALADRVAWIGQHRDQIEITNHDGLSFLKQKAETVGANTFFLIDPPYVSAGSRLYMNAMSELRHLDLAKFLIQNRNMPHWLVTYDDHPLIRSAYANATLEELSVRYSLQKKRSAGELLITPLAR